MHVQCTIKDNHVLLVTEKKEVSVVISAFPGINMFSTNFMVWSNENIS